MLVNGIQAIAGWLGIQVHAGDSLLLLLWKLPIWLMPLAQQVRDTNVIGQIQGAWNHFVQSGQIWAFFIGIIVGYFVRGMGGIG